MHTRPRDEGSIAIEAAILSIPLLILLMLAFGAGRTVTAANAVADATHSAARAASLARTPSAAHQAADLSAKASLANAGRACASITTDLDAAGFNAPIGQPASVKVTISCVVSYSDLYIPGLSGTRTFTDSFTSPLDQYRAKS